MTIRIHAVETGRVQVKKSQLIGHGQGLRRRLAPLFDAEWSDWLPVYAYAIEHPEGVILVDTGANAGLLRLPRWHPYFQLAVRFDVDHEQEIVPQLRKLGIAPRDVKTVVLTHMHIDHDGGLKDLPFSQTLAAAGEVAAASGVAGRINGYLPQRWPSGFDPKPLEFEPKPFGPFNRSSALTRDGAVIALPTPGHTDNHLSIAVVDEGVTTLLAGDASYSEANLVAGTIDGVSADEGVARATLQRINQLAGEQAMLFLPAHDPQAPARLAARAAVKQKALAMSRNVAVTSFSA